MKSINKLNLTGLVCALATFTLAFRSPAQPYYIVGDVINGWADPGTIMMNGGPTMYDYTVTGGTAGNYEALKVTVGSWSTAWPGNNLVVKLDAGGENTIYFMPGTFTDGWQPVANRLGFVDPLNDSYEIAGDFTTPNWDSDPNAQLVSAGNGLYTNTYVIATVGTHNFKFRSHGTWNGLNVGSDFGGANNATVTTTEPNQPVLFQLDLPNGRWLAGTAVAPVTNDVVFAVDMTAQMALGKFDPASDTVFVSGTFNGWPGINSGALVLTNYPVYNGGSNTNIYYATNTFFGAPNSAAASYKFTCNNVADSSAGGYEPISDNRSVILGTASGPLLLPVVKFGDVNVSDYSVADATVVFTVNMTNAVTTDGHVFDSAKDQVYINGNFIAGGWAAWNPLSLTPMENNPVGSEIYTYSATVPAGSLIKVDYKYGMGFPDATNWDNEAPAYQDHIRYLRTTAGGTYTNAMDDFGNQYVEPDFGQLASAGASAGHVAISWLGRPGVQLQVSDSLTGGSWQSILPTDGTNWISGTSSANGFVSQTNWPATGGQQFFRLIQSW
jgi:hypothetical protein